MPQHVNAKSWQQYTWLTALDLLVYLEMANTKPFVQVATFCEKVLIEKDDVPTAVRIVDTYYIPKQENLPPDTLPAIDVSGLISLKSGDVVGERRVTLVFENPLGERRDISPDGNGWLVVFNGGEHGINIRLGFPLGVKNFGLCWFDVVCDGELLTRIPLRLREGEKPAPNGDSGSH